MMTGRLGGRSKKQWVTAGLVTLVVLLLAGMLLLGYGYFSEKRERERLSNPTLAAKEQNQQLIRAVGRLVELPDEEPTVATVKDVEKLQAQAFFRNASNGDKVLIFSQSKKAVLYRPSTGKVVEVASVNLGSGSAVPDSQNASN